MTESATGKAGVFVASNDDGTMEKLMHSVADDVLYNILHDLLLKVHQKEKTAKANTAAIRIEKMAFDSVDASAGDDRPDIRLETEIAVYNNGEVYLKGNPLKTVSDVLCPQCRLPRLLYPTDGKGSRKPDPTTKYCKRAPFIDKPGYDIYGQTWIGPGPGRGKKKKEQDRKADPGNPSTSDSPAASTNETRPPNVLSFPSATCSKCKRCILVTRLNNHMSSCIGNSGRNASRAAAQKISNGNGHGHGTDATPPSSQKGTPLSGSRASSPKKREAEYLDDDEDSEPARQKKKFKNALAHSNALSGSKKVILKTKGQLGKDKDKIKAPGLGPRSVSSAAHRSALFHDDQSSIDSPVFAPRVKLSSGSPLAKAKTLSPAKKMKLVAPLTRPPLSSPLSRSGVDADGDSVSSDTLSSPH